MAVFDISDDVCMGWSCTGPVYDDGKGSVVLSKRDVETLVKLIREKGTTDVEELGLESEHPKLYQKLYRAYRKMEMETITRHWLWKGYQYGEYDEQKEELKKYCRRYCGWHFEFNPESHIGWDGEMDEEAIEDEEMFAFEDWFDDYILHADIKKVEHIFYQVLKAEQDDDEIEPYVQIPKAIIDMAQEKTDKG